MTARKREKPVIEATLIGPYAVRNPEHFKTSGDEEGKKSRST